MNRCCQAHWNMLPGALLWNALTELQAETTCLKTTTALCRPHSVTDSIGPNTDNLCVTEARSSRSPNRKKKDPPFPPLPRDSAGVEQLHQMIGKQLVKVGQSLKGVISAIAPTAQLLQDWALVFWRTAVSPELLPLPLFHGGCDKLSWLPEGKVFSNVQRERIISRFLKESVLKRVFRSKQLRRPGPSLSQNTLRGLIPRKPRSKMGRKTGESRGPGPAAAVPWENLSHWNLDAEVPAPENKSPPPGRDSATGGKINKNHLEIPAEQLLLELTFSEFVPQRTQNSKQGLFQLWSYPPSEASTTELRDFKISPLETGRNVTNNPMRLFGVNPLTGASVDKRVGSHPALQAPPSLCRPYADGDSFKDRSEPHINLCSTLENNSGELLTAPNWNLKYGNSSVEENLTDESDLSENEKANDTLLSYFKKMDLHLKPETVENVEEPFTEELNEVFPYPDFLPPPFSTLDLHKLALSKSDSWKMTVETPDSSLEPLMARLLDMERLQHLTIQRERPRLQTSFCAPVATERPPSSKAVSKMRQPKPPDPVGLQMACVEKSHEKIKNSSGSYKPEHGAPKWNWNCAGKYKWSSRPALKTPATPKQVTVVHDDFKNPKISILNPCQELTIKPTPVQTTQLLVKTISARCLPPKSPTPISPIPLCLPDSHREETQAPRTRKKLYRKDVVLSRPFCIQKLNCCLSPSVIAKDKRSPTDQK
ncbi:PREDICTED: protein FAM217A [Bison bison bison]|uniref:Protein FAM217A n=1 Tax=Bison bison bison TaxID=43346 RepID=A0A6P3GHE3_BISBB|nr:PREDICTED: protein FAM217A [Bison bison bison]